FPPPNPPPPKTTPSFRKPKQSRDPDTMRVSAPQHPFNAPDHLHKCPRHSEMTRGPPGGQAYPIPATPKAGETLHPIRTPQSAVQHVRTVRIGAHPALTTQFHSKTLCHLLSHLLPLRAHCKPQKQSRYLHSTTPNPNSLRNSSGSSRRPQKHFKASSELLRS